MALNLNPAVIGCAIQMRLEPDKALEESLYDLAQRALRDAGLTIEDIDGIVVAANDQYDGRAISVMAASGSVGGVDRDILSTPSASEHAFVLGVLRVASGQFRTQLVLSWSPTESHSIPEVQRLAADPYFHRRLPLDEVASHALQASALGAAMADIGALAEKVAAKNRRQGRTAYPDTPPSTGEGPVTWPLTGTVVSAPTSGAVALVLASPDFVREKGSASVAWMRGMGWATEPSHLGDRDLTTTPALRVATAQAYRDAGIDGAPRAAFDVAELSDATPYQELLAYEALGLCERADWRACVEGEVFAAGGELPVNLSGGAQANNAVFCTGLLSIAHAANQVRGAAGTQQRPDVRLALAQAASGFAMQYQTVVVFGREPGRVS